MRRPRGRAALSFAALALVAVLGGAGATALSGCGASATLDPIARAADVSSHQAGARIAMTMQLSSPQIPGGAAKILARGFVDEREHSGELTMDLSGIPGTSSLPGGSAGKIEILFEYPTIYMRMPALASQLPAGKTWMKLDLSKAAQSAGIDLSQISPSETDPTQLLNYLRASSGGVVRVGGETVDGAPSTHYRATLELGDVLARLPSGEQAAAKGELEKLGASGAIPVDVWIDRQERVRRMQLGIDAGGAGSAIPGVSGTVTIDFTAYGPVPPVAPPPSSEVFDATAMAQAGLAQAGAGG